jgi:hypothetical protein
VRFQLIVAHAGLRNEPIDFGAFHGSWERSTGE